MISWSRIEIAPFVIHLGRETVVQISLQKMELLWLAHNIMQQPTAGLKHFLFGEFQHARTTKDTIMAPKNTKTSRSWIPKSTGIYTQFKFNLRNSRGDPPDQSWRPTNQIISYMLKSRISIHQKRASILQLINDGADFSLNNLLMKKLPNNPETVTKEAECMDFKI